ncbi:MAG: TlpA disulfide reductase family protein [Bacteroidota bacterium]
MKQLFTLIVFLLLACHTMAQIDPLIGKKAPNIVLTNLEGQEQKLSDLEGKVVLIDFWAGWCGPCIKDIEEWLKPMYDDYKDKGFEVFAVSFDRSENAWQKSVARHGLPWQHVWDYQTKSAFKDYQVYQIPTSYLVDQTGTIVARDLKRGRLSREIDRLLKQN